MKNVIILHPKQLGDEEVCALRDHLIFDSRPLPDVAADEEIVYFTARDVFLEFEQKYGKPVNWDRWRTYLLAMTETFGTEPRYHVFVVAPESVVGRATAEIVRDALRHRRLVLRLTPDGVLVKATKVTDLDPDNFTRGWVVS